MGRVAQEVFALPPFGKLGWREKGGVSILQSFLSGCWFCRNRVVWCFEGKASEDDTVGTVSTAMGHSLAS
jgi:hypothetical protein